MHVNNNHGKSYDNGCFSVSYANFVLQNVTKVSQLCNKDNKQLAV